MGGVSVALAIQARLDQKVRDFDHLARIACELLDSLYSAGEDYYPEEAMTLGVWLLMHTDQVPELVQYPDEAAAHE